MINALSVAASDSISLMNGFMVAWVTYKDNGSVASSEVGVAGE